MHEPRITPPALDTVTQADLCRHMERELRTGWKLEAELSKSRERVLAREAEAAKGRPNKFGWRLLANIPADQFFKVGAKYGHEAWEDEEFIRDFQRHEPHLCPNKLRKTWV